MPGDLLDGGGRGIAQAVLGASVLVFVLIGLTVLTPVMLVVSLMPGVHLTAPSAAVVATSGTRGPASAPPAGIPPPLGGSPLEVVDVARQYLGVPYVFGGTNPRDGLDCSALVQLVYRQVGITLPRTAQQQYDATIRLGRADLQPGDLVFFARTYADPHDWVTHVGIYIGDGLQINAPTEGQRVSIQPVFTGFWGDHFTSGGRAPHA